jgi:hypothetical protein
VISATKFAHIFHSLIIYYVTEVCEPALVIRVFGLYFVHFDTVFVLSALFAVFDCNIFICYMLLSFQYLPLINFLVLIYLLFLFGYYLFICIFICIIIYLFTVYLTVISVPRSVYCRTVG